MASTLRPKDIGCSLLNYFRRLRPPLACRRAEAAFSDGICVAFRQAKRLAARWLDFAHYNTRRGGCTANTDPS